MLKILLLATSLFAAATQAAGPAHMTVVYDLYRNGLKLGQVTDTFSRAGDRYTLTSEARAIGPLKLLWSGNLQLESTGVVTPQGLRPSQFKHGRSDAPGKLATARLDWTQHSIAYQYKGRSWQVTGLEEGAQDQLSQLYQFMFAPPQPAEFGFQVVSGRKLNDYHFANSDGGVMQTPLGPLATRVYQRVMQQSDEKSITVWVAPARNNLPVKIRVSEDGVTLEQRLLSASVKN
jgi:hypothetical protein